MESSVFCLFFSSSGRNDPPYLEYVFLATFTDPSRPHILPTGPELDQWVRSCPFEIRVFRPGFPNKSGHVRLTVTFKLHRL